jgi:hypothetical protein
VNCCRHVRHWYNARACGSRRAPGESRSKVFKRRRRATAHYRYDPWRGLQLDGNLGPVSSRRNLNIFDGGPRTRTGRGLLAVPPPIRYPVHRPARGGTNASSHVPSRDPHNPSTRVGGGEFKESGCKHQEHNAASPANSSKFPAETPLNAVCSYLGYVFRRPLLRSLKQTRLSPPRQTKPNDG